MSKRTKTYLLLGVVLVIWGLIGFKVVNTLSPNEEPSIVQKQAVDIPTATIKKDTFTLYANYRDPFLGTLQNPNKKVKRKVSKKTDQPKKNIAYAGLVSQASSGKSMFFVTIDGQQHMMSPNQEVDGVRLLSGNVSKIRVRYNGQHETITLSE
ncbi:hypothetical protein [Flagellimonas algicola]|uniref:Type II secretion system protein GspC N-terminal domain-containing protein n=1 Tax=Flagellimonas algicola TaxID=2583815 RepID=A0ABY2WMP5_9FLAO|nr:hypothetical protein [Allomuricauda algicola]TMU55654.1 hypothetical protein FGG15_15930 [Allomuricauda algicola]